MSIQGATVSVSAGAVTAAISAALASTTYQVTISTSWVTSVNVVSKTTGGFTVNFGTQAPPGGGTFDWVTNDATAATTSAITSGTVTVAAGAVSDTVAPTASLPAAYQVGISTSWVTAVDVVSKTSAGFTVQFGTQAPVGGGTYDYIVFGPSSGSVALSDYLDELRDLLHDPDDRIWSVTQKANYINRARKRRDLDTAINRSTLTFVLTTGTRSYTFAQVGNGQIVDVLSITLIFGTYPIVLDNPSLTDLTVQGYRGSTTFTGWTTAWARQGESTVIFAPTPSQPFTTEWDCAVYLPPLVNLTDTDAVSYPYTQPVPYYAAYLAKTNEREMDGEGAGFLNAYMELVGFSTSQRAGRVPNSYSGLGIPGGRRYF